MASKKQTKYRQCVLEKRENKSLVQTTSYIPEKYAKVGWTLALKDPATKVWSEGWYVKSAGALVDEPMDPRQLIKGHRKMTGDSTPRKKSGQKK